MDMTYLAHSEEISTSLGANEDRRMKATELLAYPGKHRRTVWPYIHGHLEQVAGGANSSLL